MTFDDFEQGGLALLEKAIADRVEETYLLEFKQKHNASDLDLHKDDRRALGEALSGFANATGGTLVIGVSSRFRRLHSYASLRGRRDDAIKNVTISRIHLEDPIWRKHRG